MHRSPRTSCCRASELSRTGSWHEALRLCEADYQEVINFSFVERDWETDLAGNQAPIEVVNPIASQLAVMRSSLDRLPGRQRALQPEPQGQPHSRVRDGQGVSS
jgi:hypothetical protein